MGVMDWRSLTVTQVFIGNCFYTAGWGLVIVWAWELVAGDKYGSTVFGGFGEFHSAQPQPLAMFRVLQPRLWRSVGASLRRCGGIQG